MGESFSVGEIAELVYSRFHEDRPGQDVLVTGPLKRRCNSSNWRIELSYEIELEGRPYCVLPDQLRKKRPPQNWIALCNLETRELETV